MKWAVGEYAVVLVTVSSPEEGRRIGEALVCGRLAACVNRIDGVSSVFRWKGEVERSEEALLVIKTSKDLVGKIAERVRELHSYTVPEVIAANHMGLKVLAISCVSNMAAGILPQKISHEEVLETGRMVREKLVRYLKALLPRLEV